ncbi:TRAP transporter small permease [Salinicola sp. CR57]|uniref:TRAP transporter small permease n=1 Tax=Salinicola sp. CR57 TaxID=1949086 RepID=UPI001300BDF0|nr:TRAP transporter small permease [Salinicola sp. CR57]
MALSKSLEKLDAILTSFEERAVYILLVAMLAVVFLGVLNRFLIQLPLPWTEELARYFMIWATFVGAGLGVKRATHISIDALVIILPAGAQRAVALLANLVSFFFCAWLFHIGMDFVGRMMSAGQLSPAMRIPIYIAYAAVPCGFFLMTLRYFLKFFECFVKSDGEVTPHGAPQASVEKSLERGDK